MQNAEAHGMVGVVIFTDPGDDGPQETKGQIAYPSMSFISSFSEMYFVNKYTENVKMDQLASHLQYSEVLSPTSISTQGIPLLLVVPPNLVLSASINPPTCPGFRLSPSPTAMLFLCSNH